MLGTLQIKHQGNIFFNRQLLEQMEVLEHKSDVAATVIIKVVFCELGKSLIFKKDLSKFKAVKTSEQVEKCGLATAALTQNEHHSIIGQGERNVVECYAICTIFAFVNFG